MPSDIQRAMRSTISSKKFGELTEWGVTVEQLTVALTISSFGIPRSIIEENKDTDFDRLAFS